MASVGSQEAICRIVQDRILTLETTAGSSPNFLGLVLMEDKLLGTSWQAGNLQIYNRQDGRRISASDQLEFNAHDVCVVSDTQVAVCLGIGKIVVLSLESTNDVKRVKTLNIRREGFNFYCDSLVKWNSDKIIVSGRNYTDVMLCWCFVSVGQETVESIHNICKSSYGATKLALMDDILYISCCDSQYSINHGVYSFNVLTPGEPKIFYQHKDLKRPWSLVTDTFCVYVSDRESDSVYQLTPSGQLVTIHKMASEVYHMFYDIRHQELYTNTREFNGYGSNKMTVYRMQHPHLPVTSLQDICRDRILQLIPKDEITLLPLPNKIKQFLRYEL